MANPTSTPAVGIIERVQEFVSENKRAVLIGAAAAVLAAGGVAYYAASSSSGPTPKDGDRKPKKKSKKKAKGDTTGPILEEVIVEETESKALAFSPEQILELSEQERKTHAATLKAKGNSAYTAKEYAAAVVFYTEAIQMTPKPEPVFYSNRAACHMNLSHFQAAVEDCDEALKLDPKYIKAANRRGTALENLGKFEEALRDFTAAAIIGQFRDQSAGESVERVLTKLAGARAKEIMAERGPRLPSATFISAYFAAFRPRPLPVMPEAPTTGDETLLLALQARDAGDFTHAVSLVHEAIEQGISWSLGSAEALNLRGTFKFLMGDVDGSKDDFLASIAAEPSFTQSWVKIASVYMEQNDSKKAFECFEDGIKHDANDPDIYYHRGQVLFIMGQFIDASQNYTRSTELDDKFVFSHIQLAVAQYKAGNLANSMATFRRTLKAFPERSEPQNYYGELLLDQQKYDEAIEKFEKAIELEKSSSKSPPNVLPLVNKALALYQWKQDIAAAERICAEALRLDPECDAAVASLAQFSLQQSKLTQACEYLEKQIELSRTEGELVNTLTYYYATRAQEAFIKTHPDQAKVLGPLAQTLA